MLSDQDNRIILIKMFCHYNQTHIIIQEKLTPLKTILYLLFVSLLIIKLWHLICVVSFKRLNVYSQHYFTKKIIMLSQNPSPGGLTSLMDFPLVIIKLIGSRIIYKCINFDKLLQSRQNVCGNELTFFDDDDDDTAFVCSATL